MLPYNIPDELIINADQTPSKSVATDNVTIAAKEEKRISRTGSNDKRSITLTLCESYNGTILPSQLIYKEKAVRSLPNVDFSLPDKSEPIRLINDVLVPYIKNSDKREIFAGGPKKSVDMGPLEAVASKQIRVPKNMTHLLELLDLATNGSLKRFEKKAFGECFFSSILKELNNHPTCDVTKIKIDLRLSTLKPLHCEVM